MTDIVERLRAGKYWLNSGECCGQLDDSGTCAAPACIFGEALKHMFAAADEIERLRAALAHYACPTDCNECNGDHTPMWCGAHARAALGEDKP